MTKKDVYIIAARRTPFGRFQGGLKEFSAPHLGAIAIRQLLEDAGVTPRSIGGVYMGQVLTAGVGQNPARQAALYAGLLPSCPAVTINKVCSSSLIALQFASQAIQLGEAEIMIAGGMESMSKAPYLLTRWDAPKDKKVGDRRVLDLLGECTASQDLPLVDSMIHDGLCDIYASGLPHMGKLADVCALTHAISREDQDRYAFLSQTRASRARAEGLFVSQIVSVLTKNGEEILHDEGIRDTSFEKLQKLYAVFTPETGTVTAGNSSQLSDGAAALLLCSEAFVQRGTVAPLAKVVAFATYSCDPEWYTVAPAGAIDKLLHKTSLSVEDISYFEINEAFAVVAEYATRSLDLEDASDRVNVWGGAIALGHPIGASGARITGNLAYILKHYNRRYGIAVACNGGGEAVAVLLENVDIKR